MKKILIIADVPGWAFDHRAKDMLGLESNLVQLDLKYMQQMNRTDAKDYDLIYPMAVIMAYHLYQGGFPLEKLSAGITSVRQFRYFMNHDHTLNHSFVSFFKGLHSVNTASDEFAALFSKYRSIHNTRVGIDEQIFKPLQNPPINKTFTVGWVGSSTTDQIKGYRIVKEALAGLPVNIDLRTKTDNFVPREKMVDFYQHLDCFICSSNSEHLPLPVLEAAACGVPIISTKVGIVPEMIVSYKNGIIVERDPDQIRQAVHFLMEYPVARQQISKAIRETILNGWTWEKCWKEWEYFFIQ